MKTEFGRYYITHTPEDYRDKLWIFNFYKECIKYKTNENMEVWIITEKTDGTYHHDLIDVFEDEEYINYSTFNEEEKENIDIWIHDSIESIQRLTIFTYNN
mgnify:CR=1 FL=1